MSEGKLTRGVALITGGGGEIGGAIARRFAREGAKIIAADINLAQADAVARGCIELGGEAIAVEMDVSDAASVEAGVKKAADAFGRLTILVNVAATVVADGTVETLSLDDWNRALAINLTGTFLTCKFAVPEIRRSGGGAIVNIASQLGHMGVPLRAPYCTTKAALIHFTKILAMDHAKDRIRANTISPGAILTERSSRRYGGKDHARKVHGPKHLLGRPGEVDEVAAGALYLASDESSFVTGTDLLIDGGYVTFKGSVNPDGEFI
jgi:NAD(P)-dependent dehydrogenase (short-subunit alcohol dehydrogenase family)